MSVAARFATLLRADVHGVVDALEDRTLVLRQRLRDAADELERKRARLEALVGEGKAAENELERLSLRIPELDADATLALDNGAEDLARFTLRKVLTARRRREALQRRRRELSEEQAALSALLEEQESGYQELEARVRAELARHSEGEGGRPPEEPVTAEEVELELLRRRRQRELGGVDDETA